MGALYMAYVIISGKQHVNWCGYEERVGETKMNRPTAWCYTTFMLNNIFQLIIHYKLINIRVKIFSWVPLTHENQLN